MKAYVFGVLTATEDYWDIQHRGLSNFWILSFFLFFFSISNLYFAVKGRKMISGGFVHNTLVQRNGCRRPDVQLSSHFPIPTWPASTLLFQWQWPCPGHTIFKHTHKTNTQTGFSEPIFTEHYLISGSRPAPCPCPVFTFISQMFWPTVSPLLGV